MDLEKNIIEEAALPIFKKSEEYPDGYVSNHMVRVTVPRIF